MVAPNPVEKTWTWDHAYRRPGRYKVSIVVVSAGCDRENNTVQAEGFITVALGQLMSNGPLPPEIVVTQSPADGQDPSLVYLSRQASDWDGYVSRVEVDWGDESPPAVYDYPLSSCTDPGSYWEPTHQFGSDAHRYAAAGNYDVRATVTSVGCDGKHQQVVSTRTQVTAP